MLIIYRIIDEGQKERTAGDDTSEMEKGSRERERERELHLRGEGAGGMTKESKP